MQVLLRIANGKSNVRKVRIQSDTVIGRSPECQLKVASNQISRRHCQIVIRDTVVAIKDLGSANGTFVNGRQVPPEVEIPLTPGTRVMLGPLQFTVEYELPGMPAAKSSAEPTAGLDQVDTEEIASIPDAAGVAPTPDLSQVDTAPVSLAVRQAVMAAATPQPQKAAVPHTALPASAQSQSVGVPAAPPQVPHQAAPAYPPPGTQTVAAAGPPGAIPIPVPLPIDPAAVTVPYSWPSSQPTPGAPAPLPIPVAATPTNPQPGHIQPASPIPHPVQHPQGVAASFAPIDTPSPAEQEVTGDFNFGIFAASGSGVVVESANEAPLFSAPASVPPPDPPKPAKKGLLQMFGWGKKKPAEPAPVIEEEATATQEIPAEAVAAESFTPPADDGEALSFDVPADDETAEEEAAPDDSLQNFFNNFQ